MTRRSFRPLAAKKKLLEERLREEGLARRAPGAEAIPRRAEAAAPLSFGQERLWFLDRLLPGSPAYLVPVPTRLSGALVHPALAQAFGEIVRRHEVLRSRFEETDGKPRQVPRPFVPRALPVVDLSVLGRDDRERRARRLVAAEAARPLDLGAGRLLRHQVLRLGTSDHVLASTLHHVAFDGASAGVLLRELTALHAAFGDGRPSPLPELPVQYADFCLWQRRRLEEETGRRQLDAWCQALRGVPPVLDLPADRPRPQVPTHRGATAAGRLSEPATEALERLVASRRASLFMVLLAGFAAWLTRTTGRTDLVVGSPGGHRDRPELEGLIGFFVQTLPLRIDASGDPSFEALLDRVRTAVVEAMGRQDVPLERIVDALGIERDLRHAPLVQAMVSLEVPSFEVPGTSREVPGTSPAGTSPAGLAVSPFPFAVPAAKLDLILHGARRGSGLSLALEYATDLFDATTARRMAGQIGRLLEGAATAPTRPLSELPLASAAQHHQAAVEWCGAPTPFPGGERLEELVRRAAARDPDAPALSFAGETVAYRELIARADALAARLAAAGVGAEDRVAVLMGRGAAAVEAFLAILVAGGAYVPLDPAYPQDRLAWMLEDCQARAVVVDDPGRRLPVGGLPVLVADRASGGPPPPRVRRDASSLAYVIYTSGSTGKPKGVGVSHRSVVRLVQGADYVALSPADRVAQASTTSFDAATFEIWGALTAGACLVGVSRELLLSPRDLGAALAGRGVTTLFLTTALFHQVAREAPRALAPLTHVLFGGEAIDPDRVLDVLQAGPPRRLLHVYGPTETTTFATWHRVNAVPPGASTVPIGGPIANTATWVVDRHLRPVPPGVSGELVIGGPGLARGYLGRPAATAAVFVPDPLSGEPGGRLYRTGDRVRHEAAGRIVFLGRFDQQVKIRGFRIEPGEVEAVLADLPQVSEAVVLVREDTPGDRRLAAYVVPAAATLTVSELRSALAKRLPSFMVPAAIVLLDALPLNPNGKVDRGALPVPEAREDDRPFEPPETEPEERLAEVWQRVLGRERIGRHDDFFALGGDSILSIQIVARANRAGLAIGPQDVFTHPTVAELARLAAERAGSGRAAVSRTPVVGPVPLTPIQRFFLAMELPAPHHFNQALLLAAARPLDPRLLERALTFLLFHHDALRLRLSHGRWGRWGWRQEIPTPGERGSVLRVDLSALSPGHRPAVLERAAGRVQASLDLTCGPLVRAAWFRLAPGDERVLLAAHHLAVDGVSWRLLLEDLQTAYEQLGRDEEPTPPPRTASFRDWAQRLEHRSRERDLAETELPWWLAVETATPPPLPVDGLRGRFPEGTGRTIVTPLPEPATRALLEEAPSAYRTRIDDLLLTALARAFERWTGQPRLRLDLEGHGREGDLDLSHTVGWFTAAYPVVLSLPEGGGPGAAIKAVKEQLRAVPGRGLGYGLLYYSNEELPAGGRLRRVAARRAGSEVVFNYLGQMDASVSAESIWRGAEERPGPATDPRNPRTHLLSVTASVVGGRLHASWTYSPEAHREETIGSLAVAFREELTALVEHCRRPEARGLTPSDVPLALVDAATLDRLFEEHGPLEDLYPLSPLQEGMLFHTLADPGRSFYFEQMTTVLEGELSPELLERSLARVVERHAALRTGFVWEGLDSPLQAVAERAEVPWNRLDWSGVPEGERGARLEALLREDRRRGFDLSRPPLLRMTLVRLGPETFRLVWSWHHLLLDGWSMPLVIGELFAVYEALAENREPELPPAVPYRRYAEWLAGQDGEQAKAFWRHTLAGLTEPTPLPASGGAAHPTGRDRAAETALPAEVTARLEEAARRARLTVNTFVQAAWALVLSRHGGGLAEVVFGATTSGRPSELPGVEAMVGLFINTLPLRLAVEPGRDVASWLAAVQDRWGAARGFEATPLAAVQAVSEVPRGTPLFETLLVFENYPRGEALAKQEGRLRTHGFVAVERTNYPLTLVAAPAERLFLRLAYPEGRFDDTSVRRALGHLARVLGGMVDSLDRPVAELSLWSEGERQQVEREWSMAGGAAELFWVFERFAAAAGERPDSVAVVDGGRYLSYGELARRAGELGTELRRRGVGPEAAVAVRLPRSAEQVAALLAVLAAGGVYLPLDPSYPESRLAFMATDAGAAVTVGPGGVEGRAPAAANLAAQPEHLAYVIYTSGSTGKPKGVGVSHRALSSLTAWHAAAYRVGPGVHAAQTAGLSFDASIAEILPYLASSATLHLTPETERTDPAAFAAWVSRHGVEVAFLPTPVAEAALDLPWPQDSPLRTLLAAGDRLRRFPPESLPFELVNNYGPTENAVAATYGTVSASPGHELPDIGRPIDGTGVFVLGRDLSPVPMGAAGELCLSGASLARGYLGRPGRTAASFVPHPHASTSGERLYRTGDRVRFLPDGRLDFLGRIDQQVKVRGVRVEPGEVESALLEHPGVGQAVVAPWQEGAHLRLAAWVTAAAGSAPPEPGDLRVFLALRLPEAMVPAAFVILPELPLSPSGKIDRSKLPSPERRAAAAPSAPATPEEEALVQVWRETLGIDEVGVEDDFLALGGDSILAIQVAARARRHGLELSPGHLFSHPTIRGLARLARTARGKAGEGTGAQAEQGEVAGPVPLSPIASWFFDTHPKAPEWFNQALLLAPRDRLDVATLERAVAALLAHHDALRLRFTYRTGAWHPEIVPAAEAPPRVRRVDLAALPPDERPAAFEEAAREAQSGFDLAQPPLLQAILFDKGEAGQKLLLVAHHLVVDAISWRPLLEDLAAAYESLTGAAGGAAWRVSCGRPAKLAALKQLRAVLGDPPGSQEAVPLPPKTTSYPAWIESLERLAASPEMVEQLPLWLDPARREVPALPTEGETEPGRVGEARYITITLPEGETEALLDAAPKLHRARVEDLLLAALALAARPWTGSPKLLVDIEGHGREERLAGADLSRTVGWLTSLYPVLLELPEGGDPSAAVERVRERLLAIPDRGVGYGVLRHLSPDPEVRRSLAELPAAQISFNYLGRLDGALPEGGFFSPARGGTGPSVSPDERRSHLLSVDASVLAGRLTVRFAYSPTCHETATVEELAARFRDALATLARAGSEPGSLLVRLSPAGAEPPLVCFHAAAGQAWGYQRLARHLSKAGRPLWAFEARGARGEEPPLDSVAEMAGLYASALRRELPDGPYLLAGWSFGALVAVEAGRLLLAAGAEVPRLVIFDQEARVAQLPEEFDEVDWMLDLAGSGLPVAADELRSLPGRDERLTRVLEAARRDGRLPPGLDLARARRLFELWSAHSKAARDFRPATYPGAITVLRAEGTAHRTADPTLGWGEVAPGRVEVIGVPGEHRTLLAEPAVRRVARVVASLLAVDRLTPLAARGAES